MTAIRRLAAILAADVAGYSRLMGRMRKARSRRFGLASKRLKVSFYGVEPATATRSGMADFHPTEPFRPGSVNGRNGA